MTKLWVIVRAHKIISGFVLLLLLGGVYYTYKNFFAAAAAPNYQTAQVEKGTLVTSVSASGTIANGNNVSITTDASGVVSAVYVKNGDSVSQGEKIADIQLDRSSATKQAQAWSSYLQAKNAVDSSQAKINSLQTAAFVANQKFINDAVARGLKTDDPTYIEENGTWLQAEADYKNQLGSITASQASMNSSLLSFQQISSTITAPSSGIITNLTIAEGVPITASTGTTATAQSLGTITVAQGQLQATVNLSEADIVKILPGQKATIIIDALPDKTFTGHVVTINTNGSTSSGVTTYPTTLSLDTVENHIYPNMAMSARIITSVKDNALLIPTQAIQTQNNQKSVQVMKNNQITSVNIEVGDSNDTQTVVTSGLTEGDTVIIGTTTTSTTSGSTSPFSGLGGGNRGFGGGGTVIRRGG